MRLSAGKKKGPVERGREKGEQPRANRFKLPSTSHSRFQLGTCLFPFWASEDFRALYARAPPECSATRRGGEMRRERGIARVDYR